MWKPGAASFPFFERIVLPSVFGTPDWVSLPKLGWAQEPVALGQQARRCIFSPALTPTFRPFKSAAITTRS